MLLAHISQTLSRHPSLLSITLSWSSWIHPVSVQSCCKEVLVGCPTLVNPCEEVHNRTLLMSSSLLLQQCPARLVRLIWMVFKMGSRWPYSCCFEGCCFQDLFDIDCSILVQLASSFYSVCLVSVQMVHPYSSMDMTSSLEKIAWLLTNKSVIKKIKLNIEDIVMITIKSLQINQIFGIK